ncbi:MAG: hypothetical protein L6Q97_11815, partial [Thermoanaerobaculia bacterium]|nr:hypothetical protein [Thermoanaerobaculia bacterium]
MWFKKELPKDLGKVEMDRLQAYVGHSHADMNLVGQYENAVDILINKIVEDKIRVDLIAHPLLYLMRHSIELALKENIKYLNKYSGLGLGKIKTHSIVELFDEFERHYNKIANNLGFKKDLESEYEKYAKILRELIQKLGSDWSSFRYVYSTTGNKIFNHSEILNVYKLKEKFDASQVFLTYTADAISPYTNFVDYIEIDNSIISKSFGKVLFCFTDFEKDWLIDRMNEQYEKVKEGEIWFDKENNYNLY